MRENEMEKCNYCEFAKICHEMCIPQCDDNDILDIESEETDNLCAKCNEYIYKQRQELQELKEWNIKVETEHELMINEYETRIYKLERSLIEEDWKHRQLPKQIVGKIRKEFIKQYYESISFDSDEFMRFFDTVLKEYQGDNDE